MFLKSSFMKILLRDAFNLKFRFKSPSTFSRPFSICLKFQYDFASKPVSCRFTHVIRNYCDLRDHNLHFFRTRDEYKTSTVQGYDVTSFKVRTGLHRGWAFEKIPEDLVHFLRKRENVFALSPEELKSCLGVLAETRARIDDKNIIIWLDEMCCSCINTWSLDQTLFVFDAWLLVLAFSAFRSKFFKEAVFLWQKNLQHCSKNNVLQILYYLALSKRPPPNFMKRLSEKLVEMTDEVSDLEWAVACLSFFRTKTKVKSKAFLSKCAEVGRNLILEKENFHLISIFKCLRQAQYYDKALWKSLEDYIRNEYRAFNFIECTNFLAILSSQNVFSDVNSLVEVHCAEILSNELDRHLDSSRTSLRSHPSVRSRTKDIARFLWATTNVGHNLASSTIDVILSVLRAKKNSGEYNREPHFLVDCLQSLAISNIYPRDLLEEVFNDKFLSRIWKLPRVKPRYQIYFIYKSCEIECEDMFQVLKDTVFVSELKPLPDNSENQSKRREKINRIVNLLQKNLLGIHSPECSFVLPHIAILGVIAQHNPDMLPEPENSSKSQRLPNIQSRKSSVICIELVDSMVCCRDSTKLMGFMKTKLRQLQKLPYKVILMTSDDVKEIELSTDPVKNLQMHLRQKL